MICILSTCLTSAQELPSEPLQTAQERYEFHMAQRKTHQIIGYSALFIGVIMTTAGLVTGLESIGGLTKTKNDGSALFFSGIGVGLSSTIFLTQANKHKKKADFQLSQGALVFDRTTNSLGLSLAFKF